METYIAFLRGINVGGRNIIKMQDLKKLHLMMGHENVVTYLQSGNVIFSCSEKDCYKLTEDIESKYEAEFGFYISVFLRKKTELSKIASQCPILLSADKEAKFLHIVLLSESPDQKLAEKILDYEGPEKKQLIGNVFYIYYTAGSGRSKLTLHFIERTLQLRGTARNWNTITKVLDLASI